MSTLLVSGVDAMKGGTCLYRYEVSQGHVWLRTFPVVKRTPRGCWIEDDQRRRRWVSDVAVKRYAYPDEERAAKSFMRRAAMRVVHLERELGQAKCVVAKFEQDPAPGSIPGYYGVSVSIFEDY